MTPLQLKDRQIAIEQASPRESINSFKLSVKEEIKRQSHKIVSRLSILEQHDMLITPSKFKNQVISNVESDKTSILSSGSKSSSSKQGSLISNKKIQDRIMKKNINTIMQRKSWYPNLKQEQEASRFNFRGTPEPKNLSLSPMKMKLAAPETNGTVANRSHVKQTNISRFSLAGNLEPNFATNPKFKITKEPCLSQEPLSEIDIN